jgi:hypothetical protein
MLFITRLVMIGLLSVGITAATTAQAGNQMFTAEWYTESFGNERTGGTGASEFYSKWGIPEGVQCNRYWPRCPFQSTPTDGAGNFDPLGNLKGATTPYPPPVQCAPWANWQGSGTTARPAKGDTVFTTMKNNAVPPLYRNYKFFTASTAMAQPNSTYCNATSTSLGGFPAKGTATMSGKTAPGVQMLGKPVAGTWTAVTTNASTGNDGFAFAAAPAQHQAGVRAGQGNRATVTHPTLGTYTTVGSARSGRVGDFQNIYPYIYSYTYATLRNDAGVFGKGAGPGNATFTYGKGDATVIIKEGAAKFGGTMRMLGAYTTKVCYFRQGGCSLGEQNWRYEAVGATGNVTTGGALASGYEATFQAYYYHTALMQKSTVMVEGERFPWTTGSVTVLATGRGPHKTVHYGQGYDNRDPITGKGTVQLVTPVLTRWLQPCCNFETGGVGILRIKFVPEPQTWAILAAGISLLGVGARMRKR